MVNNGIQRPTQKKVQIYNTIVGYIHDDKLTYSEKTAPKSPLCDDYVTGQSFNLYYDGKKLSPRPSMGAKTYQFHSVNQVVAFGQAISSRDNEMASEIYNTNADYARTHPKTFDTLSKITKMAPDWERKKQVWQRLGQEAKFMQNDLAKKALNVARKYEIVNEDEVGNQEGRMLNAVADRLAEKGVLEPVKGTDKTLQNMAGNEKTESEKRDDNEFQL